MVNQSRAARASRRRQRRVKASGSDLTVDQWEKICSLWAGCAYCGAAGPWQKDCVLPISRKGRYTLDNVVPACRSCNASKGNTEVTVWMRRHRKDGTAFFRRWVEILAVLGDAT